MPWQQHTNDGRLINGSTAQGLQGGIVGELTGANSQQREYLYNLATMDYQKEIDNYWFKKKNDYDNTTQQLKRWMAAGGNPNAFFGGQNVEGAAAMSAGSGGMPSSTAGILGNLLLGGVDSSIKGSATFWDNEKKKAEAQGIMINNGTLKEINEATLKKIYSDINLQVKEGKLKDTERLQIKALLPGLLGKTNAEIENIKQDTARLIEETKNLQKTRVKMKWETKKAMEEALAEKWMNKYRWDFGIDPKNPMLNNLITASIRGTGPKLMTTMFKVIDDCLFKAGKILKSNRNPWKSFFRNLF